MSKRDRYGGLRPGQMVLFGIVLILGTVASQDDTTLVRLDRLGGHLAPRALLDTVTFEPGEFTLEEALDFLIIRGHLNLSYNRSRLPLGQMVSLQTTNITALEALLSILDQTTTELLVTTSGQLVVIPAKSGELRP